MNFDERPFIALWETTQACDLACVPCRACAQTARNPLELSTDEGKRLIDEIAALQVPVFVLTGGDPLKRPDIFELVKYASDNKVRVSLTPTATPLLTRENIVRLKQCGLARLVVSLDGPTAEIHDGFRSVSGSYDWTLNTVRWAREIELPVQINTAVTRHNLALLDETILLLEGLDIAVWSVFFLLPRRGQQGIELISAEEFEQVFARLHGASRRVLFDIRSNGAQHYQRFLIQRRSAAQRWGEVPGAAFSRFPQWEPIPAAAQTDDGISRGINDGKGLVFISHLGEVFPSGSLPISGGNVRQESLTAIYRNSRLFRSLRDSRNLRGKCGWCEFREICGGSRSRAYALTGDMFAEEPCCVYEPKRQRAEEQARPMIV